MKKITCILALLLSVGTISAQENNNERKERNQREHRKSNPDGVQMRKNAMADFSPEQIADLQTKKMTLALDLNAGQQTKIQKLNLANAKQRQEKMTAFKARKEGTKVSSKERYEMASSILDHKIAQKEALKKILSPEQYASWDKSNKGREHASKKRMGERKSKMRQQRKPRQKE